ncbi:MAG: YdbH domain-containing protein [Verrucomicrobiota bacterium]|nr:YdbH domain-containing protein [Verrucomicrobiota bacterium]
MGRKKIIKKIKIQHFLVGTFCSVLLVLVISLYFAPFFLDWGIRYLSKKADPDLFNIYVDKLNPWEMKLEDLVFQKKGVEVSIDSIGLQYNPDDLAFGKLDAFTVRGLNSKIDGDILLDQLLSEKQVEPKQDDYQWLKLIGDFLADPPVQHLRLLGSEVTLFGESFLLPFDFEVKGDYVNDLARTILDGQIAEFPFLSETRFWKDDYNTFLDTEIKFVDLNKSRPLVVLASKFWGLDDEAAVLNSGNLVFQGTGRINNESFSDLFFEINGTDISGKFYDFPFDVGKVISFFTPYESGDFDINIYGNFDLPKYAGVKGFRLSTEARGQNLSVRTAFQKIKTSSSLVPIEIVELSLPVLDLNLSDIDNFPLSRSYDMYFDGINYDDNSVSLGEGKLSLLWIEQEGFVSLQNSPLTAVLSDLNIRLVGLSLNGLIDPSNLFPFKHNLLVSCNQAFLSEESIVENLSLSFRPLSDRKVSIDSLTARFGDMMIDVSPANLDFQIDDDTGSGYKFEFNDSSIRLDNGRISLDGLVGSLSISSFDPLLSISENEISFKNIRVGDLEFKDGSFKISFSDDGEIVLSEFSVDVLGGKMEIDSAKWKLYSDYLKFQTKFDEIDGQKLANLLEGLDIQIDGNFSGIISFSNYDNIWDFGTGFLQLNPSKDAKIKFKQSNLIHEGTDFDDPSSKNLRLTAWALSDLAVDAMMINFKALEQEREIVMSINGVRETDEQRVDLDYKPRFKGGLRDLLSWRESRQKK